MQTLAVVRQVCSIGVNGWMPAWKHFISLNLTIPVSAILVSQMSDAKRNVHGNRLGHGS
jgi:hypothetical protein